MHFIDSNPAQTSLFKPTGDVKANSKENQNLDKNMVRVYLLQCIFEMTTFSKNFMYIF
jgi:hypothetical protein